MQTRSSPPATQQVLAETQSFANYTPLEKKLHYNLPCVAFVKTAPRGRSPTLTPGIIFIFNHGLCDVGI